MLSIKGLQICFDRAKQLYVSYDTICRSLIKMNFSTIRAWSPASWYNRCEISYHWILHIMYFYRMLTFHLRAVDKLNYYWSSILTLIYKHLLFVVRLNWGEVLHSPDCYTRLATAQIISGRAINRKTGPRVLNSCYYVLFFISQRIRVIIVDEYFIYLQNWFCF